MRRVLALSLALSLNLPAAAQNLTKTYTEFFGKDDRMGLYSEVAEKKLGSSVLKTIRENVLLIDCGKNGKPSTAFIAKQGENSRIYSAAHNDIMASESKQSCKIEDVALPRGDISHQFQNNGMRDDAAYDVVSWANIKSHKGFEICPNIYLSAKYIVPQSLDGSGLVGLSPICKIKSVEGELITTTCRGHYKASGAPLLSVSKGKVCVAGVFNAHSGKLLNYESYAAHIVP